eukprot:TRINITY_DN4499_c0_g2_i3.p1 TRINITY_DN4499_c0_g2~~TRINITY_DN4499_c0_g2_i3.p1  ORF type:complete len:147 (-),score=50.82 TRINITY_DN4499_c0_g2_i3:2-442(-)
MKETTFEQRTFEKDPADKIMLERKDFTNFASFHEQNSENIELCTNGKELMDKLQLNPVDDRTILRFLYTLIYLVFSELNGVDKVMKKEEIVEKKEKPSFEEEKLLESNFEQLPPVEESKQQNEPAKDENLNDWDIDDNLLLSLIHI